MSNNEEDKNLIAYCGLYCGDCFAHKGKIADLARDLRKELRQAKFDKTAESLSAISFFKVFENYGQCYEVLGMLVKFRCKNACGDGGAYRSVRYENAARRGEAVGNAMNLRPAKSWIS